MRTESYVPHVYQQVMQSLKRGQEYSQLRSQKSAGYGLDAHVLLSQGFL